MTNQDAANLLLHLALKGEKAYHSGYKDTVKYARESKAYFAGVDVDEFLKPFTRRESTELFEQRKAITAHVQKSLGHALERPFAKVPRSNWTKVLTFTDDQQGRSAKEFQDKTLDKFTTKGLDGYTFERVRYWNAYDPNTFVVVEFAAFDNTKTKASPYPFEVTADMAVDFKYDPNGELLYLVARQVEMKFDRKDDSTAKPFERLTIYRPNQTLVIQQLTGDEIKAISAKPAEKPMVDADPITGQVVNIDGTRYYQITVPIPHKFERTPAIRCGYVDNPADDGATVVGIFDAALPWARKCLKVNSEFDFVSACMAFPIRVRAQDVCPATGCDHGKLPDGATCWECHGTGWKQSPTSAMEEIVYSMPQPGEETIDATKLLQYVSPPTDAVKLLIDLLNTFFEKAKESVFNSQLATKNEVAQTAQYHRIGQEATYDTLHPYGRHIARVWKFIAEACKAFTGTAGEMTAAIIIPQDLHFETVDQLFAELKSARDAGAGSDVSQLINRRIMDRYLIDDPEALMRSRIDERHDPFPGMTETEVLAAINLGIVPEWKKVWWANRQSIMEEILQEAPAFYTLNFPKQKELIRAKVDALQVELEAAQPRINVGALATGTAPPDNPQPQGNA